MALLGDVDVSYGQVAIFQSGISNPFNDWQDTHVHQGFSWRPGSVSFRTLGEGRMTIEIEYSAKPSSVDAVRIIRVPFSVDESGEVEVATIAQEKKILLEPGDYSLVFAHGWAPQGAMWCRLYWGKAQFPVEAEILRADPELTPHEPLLMKADPAT